MGTPTEFEFFDGAAAAVSIAGSWTDWTPEPMARDGANGERWTYAAALAPGTDVEFKFVVDGNWVFASHYDNTDDGLGARNNRWTVPLPAPDAPEAPDVIEDDPKAEAPAEVVAAEGAQEEAPEEGPEEGPPVAEQTSRDIGSEMSSASPDAGLSAPMALLAVSDSRESESAASENEAAGEGEAALKAEKIIQASAAREGEEGDFDIHSTGSAGSLGDKAAERPAVGSDSAGTTAVGAGEKVSKKSSEGGGGCVIM